MTDYSQIEDFENLPENEAAARIEQLQTEISRLLGPDFDEEDTFREQARDILEANDIRNAAGVAAQASDTMLLDYIRLLFLEQQFEGMPAESIPGMFANEIVQLRAGLDIEEAEAPAPYDGPTVDISSGPAAVTGSELADAFVERYGQDLAEGPLDHSDTTVTQADLRDAIEKYESIEITQDDIDAYIERELESLQPLIDDRVRMLVDREMEGISADDPEYEARLEAATEDATIRAQEWAADMGMPRESFIRDSLRNEMFTEQYPEMQITPEQAQQLAEDIGADPAIVGQASNALAFYTYTSEAADAGIPYYTDGLTDLRRELAAERQEAYEEEISSDVANIESIAESVGYSANTIDAANTGIDMEALTARRTEMTEAFEAENFEAALNAANSINETIIADIDTRQIAAIEADFDQLQEAAAEAGYTVETPEQMYELLVDPETAVAFRDEISNDTFARGFLRGEYGHNFRALETARSDALVTRGEIENAANRYEGFELEDVDPAEMTTAGRIQAEAAVAPATDYDLMAKNIIDEFRGENGGRFRSILESTGGEFDFERYEHASEILGDQFNLSNLFDIDNPEDLAAAMTAVEVYNTGEMPDAETLDSIRSSVDRAFDQDTEVLAAANAEAAISATFAAHAASPASGGIVGFFRDAAEVGIPDGYDLRLAPDQVNGPPDQQQRHDALGM